MEPPYTEPDYFEPEAAEAEASSRRYSWATIVMGLLLALSLFGSLLWRAFPPSIFLNGSTNPAEPNGRSALPLSLPLSAAAGWMDSGLSLQANASYRLVALGQVQLSQASGFDQWAGPDGFNSPCRSQQGASCALSEAPYGALLGRIGSTEPFVIGHVLVIETRQGGRLWLAVNDTQGDYHDNQGSFTVRIERFGGGQFEQAGLDSARAAQQALLSQTKVQAR